MPRVAVNASVGLQRTRSRRWLWLAAGGVLSLAFAVRFYGLADRPPGTWFDPAYNGLDALRIMQRGGHVVFFPTNGGRESLFVYLLIPAIWMFGATPFAMRLVTALMGVLHVALLFGFLYDLPSLLPATDPLVRRLRAQRLWLATIGGLVLATSYWHLLVSLRAERPIMVPLLAVPVIWFLLKAWHSGAARWFILAGAALGLGAHTYGAARLLPVILILAALPALGFWLRSARSDSSQFRTRVVNLVWLVVAALLVAGPMAWYFVTHPAQFSARAGSVAVWNYVGAPSEVAMEMARNVPRVLGYFCCVGATTLYNGLPDYPGITPWLAPFLAIGCVGAVLNSRHFLHRLIWVWWVIGLLPSITTIEAPHPLRLLVAIVPTALLIALAPFYVGEWLTTLVGRRVIASGVVAWLPALVAGLALISLPATWRAYYIEWADSPAVRRLNDPAALTLRDAVQAHTLAGDSVYLPLSRLDDPTLLYYLGGAYGRRAALAVPESPGGAVVIAPRPDVGDTVWVRFAGDTASLLPPLTEAGVRVIRAAFEAASQPLPTADGDIAGWVARVSDDPGRYVEKPTRSLDVSFGALRLTGIRYPATIDWHTVSETGDKADASQTLPVTGYWQVDAPVRDEYDILLHLVDDRRQVWGSGDVRPTGWVYPTSFWQPGQDTVAVQHHLALQAERVPPPGRYWLAVAVYDPAVGRRLSVTAGGSGDSPDTYLVGPLKVPILPPTDETLEQARREDIRFGDVARLVGVAGVEPTMHGGERLQVTLLWRVLGTPAVDYTVFVHLLDGSGTYVAGEDAQPLAGDYPTSIWSPGELIGDAHTLRLTDDAGVPLSAGTYRLAAGMYDLTTGERVPVTLADGQTVESRAALLAEITLVSP
jgi:hypothetical protein